MEVSETSAIQQTNVSMRHLGTQAQHAFNSTICTRSFIQDDYEIRSPSARVMLENCIQDMSGCRLKTRMCGILSDEVPWSIGNKAVRRKGTTFSSLATSSSICATIALFAAFRCKFSCCSSETVLVSAWLSACFLCLDRLADSLLLCLRLSFLLSFSPWFCQKCIFVLLV